MTPCKTRNFLFFSLILVFTCRFSCGKQSLVLPTRSQATLTADGEKLLRLFYTADVSSILKSTLKAIVEDYNGTSPVFAYVTNEECIEHISYIVKKLESVGTTMEPLDVFTLHSKSRSLPCIYWHNIYHFRFTMTFPCLTYRCMHMIFLIHSGWLLGKTTKWNLEWKFSKSWRFPRMYSSKRK